MKYFSIPSQLVGHEAEKGHIRDAPGPIDRDSQAEGGRGGRWHQERIHQETVRDCEGEEEEQTGGAGGGETETSELLQKSNR